MNPGRPSGRRKGASPTCTVAPATAACPLTGWPCDRRATCADRGPARSRPRRPKPRPTAGAERQARRLRHPTWRPRPRSGPPTAPRPRFAGWRPRHHGTGARSPDAAPWPDQASAPDCPQGPSCRHEAPRAKSGCGMEPSWMGRKWRHDSMRCARRGRPVASGVHVHGQALASNPPFPTQPGWRWLTPAAADRRKAPAGGTFMRRAAIVGNESPSGRHESPVG